MAVRGRGGEGDVEDTTNDKRQANRRKVATFLAKYFKTHIRIRIRNRNRNQRRESGMLQTSKGERDTAGHADVDGEQAGKREAE